MNAYDLVQDITPSSFWASSSFTRIYRALESPGATFSDADILTNLKLAKKDANTYKRQADKMIRDLLVRNSLPDEIRNEALDCLKAHRYSAVFYRRFLREV